MTRIRIDHNVERLAEALRIAPGQVLGGIDRGMRRGAMEIAREARRRAPKASSLLTQSIFAVREAQGHHRVTALAGHSGPQEYGRKAGAMPPVQKLIDWIRARKIQPRGPGVETQRDLAFVIGRKIKRDGHEAKSFMRPALEANQSRLVALVRDGALQGAARAFAR